MGRAAKGRSIANLLELRADEKVAALICIQAKYGPNKEDQTWSQRNELFFATQFGTVKKTALSDFGNVRKGGIIAIGIEPNDTLISVKLTRGSIVEADVVQDPGDDVVLITRGGMSIRFSESGVRSMGRPAGGVRGITLDADDAVVALAVVDPKATLLVAGENGIGKRTGFDEYRVQSRGGVGVINITTSERNGLVVGVSYVQTGDELLVITQQGMILRMLTDDVRSIGRATQGVTIIDLEENDKVVSIARLVEKEEDEAVSAAPEPAPDAPSEPPAE